MAGPSASPPRLIVTSGPDEGAVFDVPAGYCEIGRLPGSGIRLDGEGISRRHAAMNRAGSHVVLADLGSTNGTFLNGDRLMAPRPLRDGDRVRIGHVELRLSVASGGDRDAEPGREPAAQDPPGPGDPPPHAAPPVITDLGDVRGPAPRGRTRRYASAHEQFLVGRDLYRDDPAAPAADGRNEAYAPPDPGPDPYDDPYADPDGAVLPGQGPGRALMVLGVLVALAGFVIWVSLILGLLGGTGSAAVPPDPFTEQLWGAPKAPLGFAAFGGGAVLFGAGAALSKAARRRAHEAGRHGRHHRVHRGGHGP
ncbi:FHA domain-containing protein [Streptomyces sp. NPDC002574]|uniref:FHA domain-containing protein n=1 Tax=Streptomyces sp. NPDC002574 TaxID=3364652 RepID=UPI00369B4653